MLRAKRLAELKFRRQHVVGNYIGDFVCLPARLIIEVDGDTHGDDEAALRDAKRTEEIERSGYRVIRFWDDYVLNDTEGGVHDAILEALLASALPAREKARLKRDFCFDPLPCGERGTLPGTDSLGPLPDPLPRSGRGGTYSR
jgi:very-short-patch-repair endonuclease